MAEKIIEIFNLTKNYGKEAAVKNLTLNINKGEVFGFLGPNGAGKTTTLLMLLGLSLPSFGKISVLGLNPVTDSLKVKKEIAYLPENVGFYNNLTAGENLEYVARLNGCLKEKDFFLIDKALEKVDLLEVKNKKVFTFSRGMRQRLGLAEVLVKEPKIIFLDEPTLGLDPDGITKVLNLITNLVLEKEVTVVLSSHLLNLVSRICSRVGILKKGNLLAQGSIKELSLKSGLSENLEEIYNFYDKK